MFSVPDRQERINRPSTIVRVGTSISTFDYKGSSNDPEQALLEVDNALLAITIETLGLTANATVGNSLFGIDNGSFLDLNLRFTNGFNFVSFKSCNLVYQFSLVRVLQHQIVILLRTVLTKLIFPAERACLLM